jgi:hypothetical protein
MTHTDPTRTPRVEPADPSTPSIGVPLVDLAEIAPDASLLTEVRRTRITTPVTRALLAIIVVAGAFLAGAIVERSQPHTTSSSAQSILSQIRAAGGAGASGAAGATGARAGNPFAGAGGATVGTVKLVDGTNVYVQDAQGNTVKVTTSPGTQITVGKAGTVSQLTPGSTVIIQGTQNAAGTSLAATSIAPSTGIGGRGAGSGGAAATAGAG